MEHLSLLADGQDHDAALERARWEKAAADVLRKSGRMTADDPDDLVWQKLTRTTLDGVEIAPLGTPASLEGLAPVGLPGQAPYTRGTAISRPQDGWDIRAHLADPDAKRTAADALLDLENGVTSLWLTVGPAGVPLDDLETALDGVLVGVAPVVLDAPHDPREAAHAFSDLLTGNGVREPAPGTGFGGDPIGSAARGVARPDAELVTDVVEDLATLARERGVLALTVDGTAVHDAGATDAQELGWSLAVGAAYLRILTAQGADVADAARLLEFRYAATDEQFPTIAKLRASRRLWHRVLELSGAGEAPGQRQHVVSSRPMMSKYDPWVNMLRGTVAAFAAGVAGADSVTVLPFDTALGMPDALARRNARNTSSLLIWEAQVARVTDPAGGSYAVERLTDDLALAGWEQFRQLEAEGGALASLVTDGGILDRIRSHAVEARARQVATRRRPLTGVTEFPHLHEELPARRPHPEATPPVERYGASFEEMRDDPPALPVFLATLGTVAQHTARATFASNLLAAGGVDTVVAGPTSTVEDLVKAYRASAPQSHVVCLAGADAAYAERGAEAAAELREAGASYVVLAGRPGERTVPPSAVDDACAIGVDALAFLTRVREALGTAGPDHRSEA